MQAKDIKTGKTLAEISDMVRDARRELYSFGGIGHVGGDLASAVVPFDVRDTEASMRARIYNTLAEVHRFIA